MRHTSLFLIVAALASCSHISKYSGVKEVVPWEDELRDRASIDLKCDPAKVVVTAIGGNRLNAAVRGCEASAVYVRIPGSWALNSQQAR